MVQGSGGVLGVYGLFKIVLDKHQKRISIEDVDHLSVTYRSFIQKLFTRNQKNYFKIYAYTFGMFFGFAFFFANFRRSKHSWKRLIEKYLGNKKKENKKIFVQKKIFCELCSKTPANVMFKTCGHLIYCWECFQNIPDINIDNAQGTCSSVKCLDCQKSNSEFKRIVYS